ncbi:S-adenosyl-L-methionine-dependent methyltransferase [Xylariaceae sp. FL0594]|nr:S-adenosyl-L-methionine-dependent methyltransferase [Xylariaceae sp. FL0594]
MDHAKEDVRDDKTSTPPEYMFNRNYVDNNRINLQHYQWVELFGYHLHPSIPTDSPLRVAARRLDPASKLEGFDISLEAVPPKKWLPDNVSFDIWDIRKPVPEHLVGVYDVVNIRLLAFFLRDEEVPSALERVVRMLKPGDYLQWSEGDVPSFPIMKTDPSNKEEALLRLFKISAIQDPRLRPTWVAQLPDLFAKSGGGELDDIQVDIRNAAGHAALAMHECNLMLHEPLAITLGNKTLQKELVQLMPEVAKETRDGACWAFTRLMVVGRKKA